MTVFLAALCVLFAFLSAMLFIKLRLLQKNNAEICTQLKQLLSQDTNNTILLSHQNKNARRLATTLNKQLKLLREMRRRYINGDREVKTTISAISHDLRTPLTAICGYLDLLKAEGCTENAKKYISIIENRTEEMKALTEELFYYSVNQPEQKELTREKVFINAALEESLAAFYTQLNSRKITPSVSLCSAPIYKELNKSALARIFENIISNAIKYSDGDLMVTLTENGVISFKNTAHTLNAVEAGKLFNRFYTVNTASAGGGLGLCIAKTLTQRMGGEITAEYADNCLEIVLKF